jgi:small-conductance mechanosensitive channel/CRP-like cAMP-binding protein
MISLHVILAQTAAAQTNTVERSTGGGAPSSDELINWSKWGSFHDWLVPAASAATFVLILLLSFILSRAFREQLKKHKLLGPVRWGTFALATYLAVFVLRKNRMVDPQDMLALGIHKLFLAIMLLVGLRFLDRLIVIPILTRGGRMALSRFVHQITLAILVLFLAAGYIHWAFNVDITSILAGSAVISIVLGLALQETLGNFFSGMVLQASVPFAPGDWILIGEGSTATEGRVVEMTWRAVTIITAANNNILIPNSLVARTKITNYHTPTPATSCSITLALDHNVAPHEAQRILVLAANDADGVAGSPAPGVSIASYDRSTITYSLGFWIEKPDQHGGIEAAVRWNAWYRLKQAGIELPYDTNLVRMTDGNADRQATVPAALAARMEAIGRSPLFSTLSPELKQQLAGRIHDFDLAPGQFFYHQDDPGNSMFLVLSGEVHAQMQTADGREVDLSDIAEGGVFGQVSAMTGQPRAATVKAKTRVRVAEITHQHLQELLARDPALAQHMSEVVAQSQARHEELSRQIGAHHPSHGQNTQPQSVLERMKSFLRW